jgi:gamma-glutamyltranspeptidase/glutathione hydrolase
MLESSTMPSRFSRRSFISAAGALAAGSASRDASASRGTQPSAAASASGDALDWFSTVPAGRSVVRAPRAMVASSQPLASKVGLDVLERGGNAVDAAIAMAAVLNVTEPNMTGIGGDAFAMVYWANTKTLTALNSSGRAPKALNLDHFAARGLTTMPVTGMEPITVPGAVDGWITLLEKFGTMALADLFAPAIAYAENGFPVAEKIAEDWAPEVGKLRQTPAAAATYLIDGAAPRAGTRFVQKNLARTLRTLAAGGRDAFYKGPIARTIVEYVQANGGYLAMEDFARQAGSAEWVEPISTIYKGYTLYELPPNNQGIAALILLNILEGIDLQAMRNDPVRYYHTLIEATKIAFADRNRWVADPAFATLPVRELLSKDYAATRRALIDPTRAIAPPSYGRFNPGADTTYFTVVDKDRNAVSFINSLFNSFGSGIVAGDTGIMLHNRGSGFSLEKRHPNQYEPGKRPFSTLVPAMLFKDGALLMSYGVMGGDIQTQGHVQVVLNLVERGLNLQESIDAPRFRYVSGKGVMMEPELGDAVIGGLAALGHERVFPPTGLRHRIFMGGGQAIMIDPVTGELAGGSDKRKDGIALGY